MIIASTGLLERNVLEWRFDPRSGARLAIADRYDLPSTDRGGETKSS